MIAVWSTLWFPRFLQHSVIQRPAECWRKRRWLLHQTQRRQEVENSYKAFIVVAKTLKGQSLENQHVWTVWSSSGLQNDIFFFGVLLKSTVKVVQSVKQLGIQPSFRQEKRKHSSFLFSILTPVLWSCCHMFTCVLPQLVFSSASQEVLRPTGPACLCSGITSWNKSAESCWDALQPLSLWLKKTSFI